MSSESVTHWVRQVEAGDNAAAQRLWEHYFRQLIGLARGRLQSVPRRVADEEDVVLSVFDSFFQDARQGELPQLSDRNDLWKLLVFRTAQKSIDLIRRHQARKRGGQQAGSDARPDLEQVLGREPTPEFAAEVADECRRLLETLGSEELRQVALLKMEGYDNGEIATRMGCVERTVERRLQVIRSLWSQESPDE
jgi:DNA-directed RNA polymerase specialized sigma24 family protein